MDGPDSPESYETTPENEVPSPKSQPSCSEEHHDEPVEDNWIKKATCVADRLAYAVETGVLADVVFLVGLTEESAEKIPAHRCILSFGSNVFKDLLTQSNNQQDIPLRVDDLDPQAFRNVLRYVQRSRLIRILVAGGTFNWSVATGHRRPTRPAAGEDVANYRHLPVKLHKRMRKTDNGLSIVPS